MNQDSLSVGDIYTLLFRHKGTILTGSALGLLAAVILFLLSSDVYRSEARLLVRYVTEATVLDPEATGDRMISPGRGGENVINSEIQILTSRDLVEKVVDDMGVVRFAVGATNPVNRIRTAELIQRRLRIEVPKNSNIIVITFDGPDPLVAQEFLRRLTDAYLARHVEVHRSVGAYEFLSQQTDQLRSRLAETEEELRKIKYSEGIVSIEESKKNAATRIEELTKGLGELDASLAASLARVEFFKGLPAARRVMMAQGLSATTNPAGLEVALRLQRLRQKEAELLALYTADSIPVSTLREQIRETLRGLEASRGVAQTNTAAASAGNLAEPELPDPLTEERATIAALQAKMAVHKERLKQAVEEARRIDSVEAKIVQLQRSKELQEANYKYFSQSLEHARIDDALNAGKISNISIVQPATRPTLPLRLDLVKRMGLALFLGVALGLGLAMAREYLFDHTIRSASELAARIPYPVLASVPWVRAGRYPRRSRGEGPARPGANLQEYCEILRDRLLMSLGTEPPTPCVVGVTSCARASGVSTLAAGLSLELSRAGDGPVLLVNGGDGTGHPRLFGVNPFAGVTDVVAHPDGNTALVQRSMYLVPAEEDAAEGNGATPAQRFAQLIAFARQGNSRFAVVDLPPVDETSVALRVGRLLDGVILVLASERVNRYAAGHARELLERSGVRIIGTILNLRRQYVPDWLYHRR
jgi:uncharacterized protein involved in exopolysaccharide biosynthesis/Mrp family chromosome partitioning ATPase